MNLGDVNHDFRSLRGQSAVVGTGLVSAVEGGQGRTEVELAALASIRALADANIPLREVDGFFGASAAQNFPVAMIEYLGISPQIIDGTNIGGSSFEAHCLTAAMALHAGVCNVALICYGSTQRSNPAMDLGGRTGAPNPYDEPYNPRHPISDYAMVAKRHMHEFGSTREQFAEVALSARVWAGLNPLAAKRDPSSVEEILSASMICDPLTVRDCCLVTDGAGALVMVRAGDVARSPRPPIYMLGAGVGMSHWNIAQMPNLTTTVAKESSARAYAMAGLTAGDINIAQVYDAFTISVVLAMEDLGFCAKGEGGAFVASGAIKPGGSLPINTNGGGLSCMHPGMYGMFLIIEAVEQLRGSAGARQVKNAETALCHGNGGFFSAQATTLWGVADTL